MKTKPALTYIQLGAIALLATTPIYATDYTWVATDSARWDLPASWQGGVAPSGADVDITTPANFGNALLYSTTGNNFTVRNLRYDSSSNWFIYPLNDGNAKTFSITNTLTKAGSGRLTFRDNGPTRLNFQAAGLNITGGALSLGQDGTIYQISSVTVTGKTTIGGGGNLISNATSATFGEVELGASGFGIYSYNNGGAGQPRATGGVTVRGLSGNNANARIFTTWSSDDKNLGGTLRINSASATDNFTYAGKIINHVAGTTGSVTLSLVKDGAGTQRLRGENTYTGTTSVNDGALIINGTHTNAGRYDVTGGLLAGNGTIATDNADIVVSQTGRLSAGEANTTDTLTLNLGTGTLDLSAATQPVLEFTLGAVGESDMILLSSGILNIGLGKLDLDLISLSTVSGFGEGSYTLISTTESIVGTLGDNVSGVLNGYNITLALSGDTTDLILQVSNIPEPGAVGFGLGALALLLVCLSRRKKQ